VRVVMMLRIGRSRTRCSVSGRSERFLGAFAWSLRATITIIMSVHLFVPLSVCINTADNERISLKFDTGASNENLSRNSKFG